MKTFRIAAAALAIAFVAGMQNDAQADGWYVRVEVRHKFSGQYRYPTLYSAEDQQDAYFEQAWFEFLMKKYPAKFQSDVLAPLGYGSSWVPQYVYVIYLPPLFPTGR